MSEDERGGPVSGAAAKQLVQLFPLPGSNTSAGGMVGTRVRLMAASIGTSRCASDLSSKTNGVGGRCYQPGITQSPVSGPDERQAHINGKPGARFRAERFAMVDSIKNVNSVVFVRPVDDHPDVLTRSETRVMCLIARAATGNERNHVTTRRTRRGIRLTEDIGQTLNDLGLFASSESPLTRTPSK